MKTKTIILTVITLVLFANANAQDESGKKDYLFSYEGKKKTNYVGFYGGLNANYATIMDKPCIWLGYRLGIVFNNRFVIGSAGYALGYDDHLTEIVDEGSYRLEAGYAGTFIEYMIPVSENFSVNLSLVSAAGTAQYKYEKEYAENLQWYEEIIDKVNFGVFEPGIELNYRLGERWAIGAHATYRHTAPITLEGTDEDIFNTFNAGIALRYGIY